MFSDILSPVYSQHSATGGEDGLRERAATHVSERLGMRIVLIFSGTYSLTAFSEEETHRQRFHH